MKKTGTIGLYGPEKRPFGRMGYKISLLLILAVFAALSPLYGNDRPPIDINLIIDSSGSLSLVKNEVTSWVCGRLDQILVVGDRVTIWSAGSASSVIYTGRINSDADKETVKTTVRDIAGSGGSADFSGALRDASSRQSTGYSYSYTLLISASPAALTSVISGPQASLLRFSRVEEFTNWRALVVGLNLDARVRRAAAAFFGS